MDCRYCQDMELLYKNEKNTMHVNKLESFKIHFLSNLLFPQLCYSVEGLLSCSQDSLQRRNKSARVDFSTSAASLIWGGGFFLKKYWHLLCILCVSPQCEITVVRIILNSLCNGNQVLMLTGQVRKEIARDVFPKACNELLS